MLHVPEASVSPVCVAWTAREEKTTTKNKGAEVVRIGADHDAARPVGDNTKPIDCRYHCIRDDNYSSDSESCCGLVIQILVQAAENNFHVTLLAGNYMHTYIATRSDRAFCFCRW